MNPKREEEYLPFLINCTVIEDSSLVYKFRDEEEGIRIRRNVKERHEWKRRKRDTEKETYKEGEKKRKRWGYLGIENRDPVSK